VREKVTSEAGPLDKTDAEPMGAAGAADSACPSGSPDSFALAKREVFLNARQEAKKEAERTLTLIESLSPRDGNIGEAGYFLSLLREGREGLFSNSEHKLAAILCLPAPMELFYAFGYKPFKIQAFGSSSVKLASPYLPAVMCPMLRSALGILIAEKALADLPFYLWVFPTTCDWTLKFPRMAEMCGIDFKARSFRLDFPHLKERPLSQKNWQEEINRLCAFLMEAKGLSKFPIKELRRSVRIVQRATEALHRLSESQKLGKISPLMAQSIRDSFFLADPVTWTFNLNLTLSILDKNPPKTPKAPVFLAGSPFSFPDYKLLKLMEETGLTVVLDDLCSSQRLLPGPAPFEDGSAPALLKTLAQRYREGCLCPTFANNDRRINSILNPNRKKYFKGVVFNVLKGCHPYDLESLSLEREIKSAGLRFLKIESDITGEDGQNLLVRLEAFRESII
jgi:benzoyl-CoA reductase/2-hydroxyglutaryl-CoA dehydratase subunit BcrC/BadD/HgdB